MQNRPVFKTVFLWRFYRSHLWRFRCYDDWFSTNSITPTECM